MRPGKFFGVFFAVHVVASAAYYFLSGQLDSSFGGPGGGHVGLGVFGGLLFLFQMSGHPTISGSALSLIIFLNSALTAGVATGIFLVVRRLRAA